MPEVCDECDSPTQPLSPVPGSRGSTGAKGDTGDAGPPGAPAFTETTEVFTQPDPLSPVTISVGSTVWMDNGLPLYIREAGYFLVDTVHSEVSVTVLRLDADVSNHTIAGYPVSSGKKVCSAGYPFVDSTAYDALEARVVALESGAPAGTLVQTYYQASAPTGTITVGSLWFDTDDNYKLHRWDGSGWVLIIQSVELPDFGVGLVPIRLVSTLPSSGMVQGDVVFLTTDNKLYRYTGSAWTAAIAGSDITGTIDGTQLAANSVVAGKIAAGAISSTHVGANLLVANVANIADALITDAKIVSLSVAKLVAGTIDSQLVKIKGSSGAIQSDNFSAGTAGFRITGDGDAEFNSVVIRNGVQASSLSAPAIAPGSQDFTTSVSVTITGAGGTIRYTTNGTEPVSSSTAYSGAISVTSTTVVRAKIFAASGHAGPEAQAVFTKVPTAGGSTPTFSLTLIGHPSNLGTPVGGAGVTTTHAIGDVVAISADANVSGDNFTSWSSANWPSTVQNPYDRNTYVHMTGNITLYANYN